MAKRKNRPKQKRPIPVGTYVEYLPGMGTFGKVIRGKPNYFSWNSPKGNYDRTLYTVSVLSFLTGEMSVVFAARYELDVVRAGGGD